MKKKCGSRLEVAYKTAHPIQPTSFQIGLDWLCYLSGNSQIFKFFTYETDETHALAFLKHIILGIGGLSHYGDEGYPIPRKDDYYQQESSLNVWGVPLPASSIGAPSNIF